MASTQNPILTGLERELFALFVSGATLLLALSIALGGNFGWQLASAFLTCSGVLLFLVFRMARQRLSLNRPDRDSPPYTHLGWGNGLTLTRGWLISLAGGFLFVDTRAIGLEWLPAMSYSLAALIDRFDGYLARRTRQVSLLGIELDIRCDALGLVVAPLLAIIQGRLHFSYLALSAAYYCYRWAMQRRLERRLPIYPLPENPLRRLLAGFQMGLVALALWPGVDPQFGVVAGIAFMLPVLFGFVADWAVVTGRVDAGALDRLADWRERCFLPVLRVLLVLAAAMLIYRAPTESAWIAIWLPALMLVLLGVLGRLGALIILTRWAADMSVADGISLWVHGVIIIGSWILLLGTGNYSIGPRGDAWLYRYDGE